MVIWTKNGEKTLSAVLARIEQVIPKDVVCHKILVDDNSVDETVKIAKEFSWQVYPNPKTGISCGANEALRHVDTDSFASFEQDLLLSKSWWNKIAPQLKGNVVVVSGLRFSAAPEYFKKLEIYCLRKFIPTTIDNTLWRTQIVRDVGGFPYLLYGSGVDTVMFSKIQGDGWKWLVDCSVQSTHLHGGLKNEMKRQYWYGLAYNRVKRVSTPSKFAVILRCLMSPLSSLNIVFATRCPEIVFAYPLLRLSHVNGMLKSR